MKKICKSCKKLIVVPKGEVILEKRFCRDCLKQRRHDYYIKNRKRLILYSLKYIEKHPEIKKKRLAYHKEYKNRDEVKLKDRLRDKIRLNSPKHRKRLLCRSKTRDLVRSGKLLKFPCCICRDLKSQAHHTNYNDPYTIIWFCDKHHRKFHRKPKKLVNLK